MTVRKTRYVKAVALAAAVVAFSGCSSSDGRDPPPPAGNTAPAISAITDRSADQDTAVGPISFGIADSESDLNALTLAVSADSNAVFAADGLAVSGTGATRSLTLMPLEAATGATTITLTLTDPQGATTTRSFRVTVNARATSLRAAALSTFAKAETDDATPVNGFTFDQDADDPATFEPLIGAN